MKKFGLKYFGLVAGTTAFFMNFIACGSSLYQVSVEEDMDERAALNSNPEAKTPGAATYGIHSISGWRNLPIPYQFDPSLDAVQKEQLQAAMARWERAIGKKLFEFKGVQAGITGDSFQDLYSSLDDNVNGHYLDSDWKKTKKPDYVLATTIWNNTPDYSAITKADIRFNNQLYIIGDSLLAKATDDKEVVDMQSLALHELGHLLGLSHVEPDVDRLSIMNPSLLIGEGLTSRQLSKGDMERIQTIYGCTGQACDIEAVLQEESLRDSEIASGSDQSGPVAH